MIAEDPTCEGLLRIRSTGIDQPGGLHVPYRPQRVQIQLASIDEPIVISWETREEILARLTLAQAAVGDAFRAVGASSPARFTIDEKEQLLIAIDEWMRDVGSDRLPEVSLICGAR